MRVAFSPDLGFARVDPEIAAHVAAAARRFEDLGAHVEEIDPGIGDVTWIFDIHWQVGVANALGKAPPEALALLDPGLDKFVLAGSRVPARRLSRSPERTDRGGSEDAPVPPALQSADSADARGSCVSGRSARATGCRRRRFRRLDPVSYPFNLTLQPALSVPCGFTEAGLPIGLQIVGAMYQDALVLRVARAFEQAVPLSDRHPPG